MPPQAASSPNCVFIGASASRADYFLSPVLQIKFSIARLSFYYLINLCLLLGRCLIYDLAQTVLFAYGLRERGGGFAPTINVLQHPSCT